MCDMWVGVDMRLTVGGGGTDGPIMGMGDMPRIMVGVGDD